MPPRVSIVVPAWVAAERLTGALAALARCAGRDQAEVIVVLNGASDGVRAAAERAAATQPIILVDSPVNLGFGGGATLGASRAGAPLIILLNDDTEPEPAWLLRLLDTADAHPEAGAIGSLILGPDGLVEECGGEISADGWSVQCHAGEPRAAIAATGPSPVGYCSAAALLIRRFPGEGPVSFDPRYHPAYYEDLDLCVSLARAGRAVLVEPRAVVRHHRSASTHLRYRDFLSRRNHDRFVAKWDWGGEGGWQPDFRGRPWTEPPAPADPVLAARDLATARDFAADLVATADRLEAELVAARERIHADHGELVALSERIHALQRRIDDLQARWDHLMAALDRLPAPVRRLARRGVASTAAR